MSRKPPSIQAPAVKLEAPASVISQTRYYKVITPLFGGGVSPAEADPVTIIRATEVRGHLRFWWRATRGWVLKTLTEMKSEEERIWGSSAAPGKPGPSGLTIQVKILNRGSIYQAKNRKGETILNAGHPSSIDGYVAFPLRDRKNPVLLENVEFELVITFPSAYKDAIDASIWAWEVFGGIGARTRRGFGALQCIQVDGKPFPLPTKQAFNQFLIKGIADHVAHGVKALEGVPHLSRSLTYKAVAGAHMKSVMDSWRYLVGKLQSFRQMRSGKFGRSHWPEPDAIRRMTRRSAAKHKTAVSNLDKFPRAKFGLPIIYQFKEYDVNLIPGDPKPTTLQGANHDRLASPLILRPIACSDGAVGLAAILEWTPNPGDESYTPPGGLVLKDAPGNPHVYSNLTPKEAASIPPLNGQADILQAFLEFLK